MNNYDIDIDGYTYTRVQKRTALKLYNDHKSVWLAGDKYLVGSTANKPIQIEKYDNNTMTETSFDVHLNSYNYYNTDLIRHSILYFVAKRHVK